MPLNVWSIIEQGKEWCPKGMPLSPWRIRRIGPSLYDIRHRGQVIASVSTYREAKRRANELMSIWIV